MPVSDTSAAKELIGKWIENRRLFQGETFQGETKPIPGPFSLHFICIEAGIPFTVLQPKIWETSVLIISEVTIGEEHIKSLEAMRIKDRDEFLRDFQKELMFAPAQYAFDPSFDKTNIPKSVQFSKEVCYDGLTEDRLSNAMRDVVRCAHFVIWYVRKEFGKTEAKKE